MLENTALSARRTAMARVRATLLLAAVLAAGCAGSGYTGSEYNGLYSVEPGPYEARIVESLAVFDPVQDREVTLRVIYPDAEGPFPLVVFSSGMFCYPQMYDRITAHWVSHGYVVVLPNHLDSPNMGKIKPEYLARLLSSRIRDMSFVLDDLEEIEAGLDITGRIDPERVAAAGHSFGGMISMAKSGLTLKEGEYIYPGQPADARFQAAVVMSGVGPMKQMTDNAFDGLTGPLISSGGSLDVGNVGTGEIFPWEWRLSGYTLAPDGDKYFVALEDADHYLGGLICRDNQGGEADPDGVAINRSMSTAFLDAYIKEKADAKKYLNTADIAALTGGRVRFERK
jgi:pimeloyl-ACP methyl ester carboxylesterase